MLFLALRIQLLKLCIWLHAVLAQALCWVRQRDLLFRTSAPRPGDVDVSRSWLGGVLREHGMLAAGDCVRSVRKSQLGGGLVANTFELVVEVGPTKATALAAALSAAEPASAGSALDTYTNSSPAAAASAAAATVTAADSTLLTLVLKCSYNGIYARNNVLGIGANQEVAFYNHATLKKHVGSVRVPRMLYAYASELLGEYVMLMEDVRRPGVVPMSSIFGNQCWGVPTADEAGQVDTLRVVFQQAAEMHALHWCDATLKSPAWRWLKQAPQYAGEGRVRWEASVARCRSAWAIAKQLAASGAPAGIKMSPSLVKVIDASLAATSWDALQAHLRNPAVPFTLVHGDHHAGNMFFVTKLAAETPGALVLDWSEVGVFEPTSELGQMLISDVKPAIFVQHAKALIRAYHEHLTARLSPEQAAAFPFSTCWMLFRRASIARWIWMFAVLAALPQMPLKLNQYFHDQLAAFVEAFAEGESAFPILVVCALF